MIYSLRDINVRNQIIAMLVCASIMTVIYHYYGKLNMERGLLPNQIEGFSQRQFEEGHNVSNRTEVSEQDNMIAPIPSTNFNTSTEAKKPEECYRYNLGPTQADDLAKIESYKFDGFEQYKKDLFQNNTKRSQEQDKTQMIPTFVSGVSSNHFLEALVMIETFNETVRAKYNNVKLIIFDIGLKGKEIKQLENKCQCDVRTFHFEKYPKHVRILPNFAWKAIVIQTVANEYPFICWMDASIRLITNDLDALFKQVQEYGMAVRYAGRDGGFTITEATHPNTFQFLNEQPCTYGLETEAWSGFMMFYANPFIKKYFLYPFVACALTFGCMEPELDGSNRYRVCLRHSPRRYHVCHRSDQSVVGILFHRLFHSEPEKHKLDTKYFRVCRAPMRKCPDPF